jgi:hypothetical protein
MNNIEQKNMEKEKNELIIELFLLRILLKYKELYRRLLEVCMFREEKLKRK